MQPTQLSSRAIERPRFSFESKTFRLTRLQRDWLDFRWVRMKLNLKKKKKRKKGTKRENKMIVTDCYCDGFSLLYYWIRVFICKPRQEISIVSHSRGIKNRQQREKKTYLARFSVRLEKCRAANYGRTSYWIQNNFNLLPRWPSNTSSTIVKLLDTKQYSFAIL